MTRVRKIIKIAPIALNIGMLWLIFLTSLNFCAANVSDTDYHIIQTQPQTVISAPSKISPITSFCDCSEDRIAAPTPQRTVDTSQLLQRSTEKEFQYERLVKDEASSFWVNFKNWLMRKLFGKIDDEASEKTINIIYLILAFFGIFTVSFWLYKSEFFGSPLRRTTKVNNDLFDETERSEEDIESQINEALSKNDFPLAIRWVYIRSIKLLSAKNQIKIRQDKTNYDYYLELNNQALQTLFLKVTKLYEYTNYGNFIAARENYNEAEMIFKTIQSKV